MQRWRWLVVLSSVVVVAVVVVVLVANSMAKPAAGGSHGQAHPAGGPPVTVTQNPTPGQSPNVNGSVGDDPIQLPSGFHYYLDPTYNWTIAMPNGWVPFSDPDHPTMTMFEDPTTRTLVLGVDRDPRPGPAPAAAFTAEAKQQVGAGKLPGYKQITIASTTFLDKPGASWEYTYMSPVGLRHAIDTNFTVNPALGCGVYWATPDDVWDYNYATYTMIAISFRPGH